MAITQSAAEMALGISRQHNQSIETELKRLLDAGIAKERISLAHYSSPFATVIKVDDEPIRKFTVNVIGGHSPLNAF